MVKVHKAQRIAGDMRVPDLCLVADVEMSRKVVLMTAASRAFFEAEAYMIAEALYTSLPGGTMSALLIELLDRKRSLLYVQAK